MKKMKRILTVLLAAIMLFSTLTFTAAAEEDGYLMYLAFGGDFNDGSWDAVASETITATANVGDTVTIGLTFDSPVVYTWYMAPVLVAEGVTELSYTIEAVTVDGVDVTDQLDLTLGDDAWWYESTDSYSSSESIRLMGGYNEWANAYLAINDIAADGYTEILYTITIDSLSAGATASAEPVESTEEYELFIAGAFSEDWSVYTYGPGNTSDGVEADLVTIKSGETVSVSVTLPTESDYTWFVAPCLIMDDPSSLADGTSFDVKVYLDGEEIEIDLSAGDNYWAEDTGDYSGNCVRIAGGYNEWGTMYIAEAPSGFTTITFEISATIMIGGDSAETLSYDEYEVFIAGAFSEDWSVYTYGPDNSSDGVDAEVATLKSGETTTVTVTLPTESDYTWFVAPCMIIDDPSTLGASTTFDVKVYLDGEEIEIDLSAGDNFWTEDTGNYSGNCVRIAGGYNEWGTMYIAEAPSGFTTITFEITPMIYIAAATEEEAASSAAGPVDLDGTYNAYLGIQTPKYSFRNAFDDGSYGRDTDYFNQITAWDDSNNAYALSATITDAVIEGNGTYTISITDIEFPDGEFDSQDYMNLIFISTDIPNTDEITISDVVLKINGSTVELASVGAIVSPDSVDYLNILLQNIWNSDVTTLGYYATPFTSISITFTVSGFNYDKVEEVEEEVVEEEVVEEVVEEEVVEEVVEETTESSSNAGVIAGVAAVVVVAAGAGVVVAKKKKK